MIPSGTRKKPPRRTTAGRNGAYDATAGPARPGRSAGPTSTTASVIARGAVEEDRILGRPRDDHVGVVRGHGGGALAVEGDHQRDIGGGGLDRDAHARPEERRLDAAT